MALDFRMVYTMSTVWCNELHSEFSPPNKTEALQPDLSAPSHHLAFGRPTLLFPSDLVFNILFGIRFPIFMLTFHMTDSACSVLSTWLCPALQKKLCWRLHKWLILSVLYVSVEHERLWCSGISGRRHLLQGLFSTELRSVFGKIMVVRCICSKTIIFTDWSSHCVPSRY